MALMIYDQYFLPVDDIYSYWDSPDCHTETYSIFPLDVTTIGTAVSPLAQYDDNSLRIPMDGQWSSSSSSPFRQNRSFCFCNTFQSTEYTEMQACKSSTMQHTNSYGIKPQTTAHFPACAPKNCHSHLVRLEPSPLAQTTRRMRQL
jgi:hypothetical protein